MVADFDQSFNGNYNSLNLVARTDTAAAFTILAAAFSTFALVTCLFGIGRIGFQVTIARASTALGYAGAAQRSGSGERSRSAAVFGLVAMSVMADTKRRLGSDYTLGYSFDLEVAGPSTTPRTSHSRSRSLDAEPGRQWPVLPRLEEHRLPDGVRRGAQGRRRHDVSGAACAATHSRLGRS